MHSSYWLGYQLLGFSLVELGPVSVPNSDISDTLGLGMPGTMTPNKSTHAPMPVTKHNNLDTLSNSLSQAVFTIHPTITDIIFPLNILLKGPSSAQPRTQPSVSPWPGQGSVWCMSVRQMGQLYRDYSPQPPLSFRIGHWERDIKLVMTSDGVDIVHASRQGYCPYKRTRSWNVRMPEI